LSEGEKYRFIKIKIVDFGPNGVGRLMALGEAMLTSIDSLTNTVFITYCQGHEVESLLHELNMTLIGGFELHEPKIETAEQLALAYARTQAEHCRASLKES
jgi:hypothetical protein